MTKRASHPVTSTRRSKPLRKPSLATSFKAKATSGTTSNGSNPARPASRAIHPGLEALDTADLMVMFLRFRELPDADMKRILDYTNSGKPIVALRTSTHPFYYQKHKDGPYAKYTWNNPQADFKGGYGRQVLGETWVNHYGIHGKESTRGLIAPGMENHPILRGVKDIWGESDVYEITTLAGDSKPLVLGQVLAGMQPNSPPNPDKKLTPVAWTKSYTGEAGKKARVFMTTMGHPVDFKNEGFRRLVVNGCYWAAGLESKISAKSSVDFAGPYDPSPIGASAGAANTTGNSNSFFGASAGLSNTTGIENSFFGEGAGYWNTTGGYNAFRALLTVGLKFGPGGAETPREKPPAAVRT